MLQLPITSLPSVTQKKLDEYQKEVNAEADFSAQVKAAKKLFGQRNTKTNAAFKVVRQTLAQMCVGARRCCYCEDSVADEVEHIYPKDLYPEKVFEWRNYLYACGPCNGPKNNQFAVFSANSDLPQVLTPSESPPPKGDPVLIDPRGENPLDFLELDFVSTFLFLPLETLTPRDTERAKYTLAVLALNNREYLRQAREDAFKNYIARFKEYIQAKEDGEGPEELMRISKGITQMNHPTVWAEIKRQHNSHPKLNTLFQKAPEALTW